MNEETPILHVLPIVAAVAIGLGAIIWQIFRSECRFDANKKNMKKNRP